MPHGPRDAPGESQEKGHGVIGEVDADDALGAGHHDVTLDEVRVHHVVDARAGYLDPLEAPAPDEHVVVEVSEHDVDLGHHLQGLAVGVGLQYIDVVGDGLYAADLGVVELGICEHFHCGYLRVSFIVRVVSPILYRLSRVEGLDTGFRRYDEGRECWSSSSLGLNERIP